MNIYYNKKLILINMYYGFVNLFSDEVVMIWIKWNSRKRSEISFIANYK